MATDATTTLETLISKNAKATRRVFCANDAAAGRKRIRLDPADIEPETDKHALSVRLYAEYSHVVTLPEALAAKQPAAGAARRKQATKKAAAATTTGSDGAAAATTPAEESTRKLIEGIPAQPRGRATNTSSTQQTGALVQFHKPAAGQQQRDGHGGAQTTSLMRLSEALQAQPRPEWHKPWKLHKVIAGHLGWVRSVAVEPDNKWFVTGSGDRTIKVWDLASGQLRLTLTGHISTVRGLAVSSRHPYLFSCGEDKMVKCWDLETNKVIRHYHGHLSGVYCLSLHPTLDVLVTGGRDGVARVWDMRTRSNM